MQGAAMIQKEDIQKLKAAIETADAIVIGSGAGLSTAAGFTYTGERFERYFRDFADKYRFRDMYSGGFYPFETPEENWAYWSRYIYINRYMHVDNGTYKMLADLFDDRESFIISTNVDHQWQAAGWDNSLRHRLRRRHLPPRGRLCLQRVHSFKHPGGGDLFGGSLTPARA